MGAAKVQKSLHRTMVEKVFRAPINLFFEVTPIGLILNRFSKDIGVIDREIFIDFGQFLVTFYLVITSISVAIVSVPMIFPIVGVFLALILWVFKCAVRPY